MKIGDSSLARRECRTFSTFRRQSSLGSGKNETNQLNCILLFWQFNFGSVQIWIMADLQHFFGLVCLSMRT